MRKSMETPLYMNIHQALQLGTSSTNGGFPSKPCLITEVKQKTENINYTEIM